MEIGSYNLLFLLDRDPLVDVGMRMDLMNMLVDTYHPLWLTIALEVNFVSVNSCGISCSVWYFIGRFW